MTTKSTLKPLLALLLLAGAPLLTPTPSIAQEIVRQDDDIKKMINQLSAQNLEQLVRKMVSFGTRHTLSSTTSKKEGIGAAREWVKSEFEKYAQASGGA